MCPYIFVYMNIYTFRGKKPKTINKEQKVDWMEIQGNVTHDDL